MNDLTTSREIFSRAELLASGMSSRMITIAVRSELMLRVRRDHYARIDLPERIRAAVRIGGRLGCVSMLARRGIFVGDSTRTHVHIERTGSRLRGPAPADRRLKPENRGDLELHWSPLVDPSAGSDAEVGVVDALVQAVLCQAPRMAVATLDSALHLGFVSEAELGEVFRALPNRLGFMRGLLDGRAESGLETLLRLIVRRLGYSFELQVVIRGVGRVDILVDGRLILEADSREHHSGWAKAVRDRSRDLAAAALGIPALRPTSQHIVYEPELVIAAIKGILGEPAR